MQNKKVIHESLIKLYDEIIERVSQFIIQTDDLINLIDFDRFLNKFLRQSNSMYLIINFNSRQFIYYLFKTYSYSFNRIKMCY